MSMYKRDFLIKDEKFFDKLDEIWGKGSNIIKTIIIENLHIIKNIYKLKKKFNTKEGFHCICK